VRVLSGRGERLAFDHDRFVFLPWQCVVMTWQVAEAWRSHFPDWLFIITPRPGRSYYRANTEVSQKPLELRHLISFAAALTSAA
jgi:hypothetical protein